MCPARSALVDIAKVLIVLLMLVTLVIVTELTPAIEETVKVDATIVFEKTSEG
jgi:hypothetical protein